MNFIEDLETLDSDSDTLEAQFERVKQLTTDSQVMQWGNKSFGIETMSSIFGNLRKSNGWRNSIRNLIR